MNRMSWLIGCYDSWGVAVPGLLLGLFQDVPSVASASRRRRWYQWCRWCCRSIDRSKGILTSFVGGRVCEKVR